MTGAKVEVLELHGNESLHIVRDVCYTVFFGC
jgi:hypothetical protein